MRQLAAGKKISYNDEWIFQIDALLPSRFFFHAWISKRRHRGHIKSVKIYQIFFCGDTKSGINDDISALSKTSFSHSFDLYDTTRSRRWENNGRYLARVKQRIAREKRWGRKMRTTEAEDGEKRREKRGRNIYAHRVYSSTVSGYFFLSLSPDNRQLEERGWLSRRVVPAYSSHPRLAL